MPKGLLLITGATGLIGSHVAEQAAAAGYALRVLVRERSPDRDLLQRLGAEEIVGELTDPGSVRRAVQGVRWIVHSAAVVGDWGPVETYQRVNVTALDHLLTAARGNLDLERFVMLSSLGVYEPRDHFGTDETVPPCPRGFDGYTRTKIASERLVSAAGAAGLPVVTLRPGFVYGARDRHLVPRLLVGLKERRVAYIGSGRQLLDHTYVKNLTGAVLAALSRPGITGEAFNITDEPLVSRVEFIETMARLAGLPLPTLHVPRPLAYILALFIDRGARLLGFNEPPLVSMARYKFLALHLEYSIAKAKERLGYRPSYTFAAGMEETVRWFLP